jgi:hypothetical protein
MTVILRAFCLVVLGLFITDLTFAQDSIKVVSKHTDEEIDINYLAGVKTENFGLKVSAAYYLGERKSQKAVLPLMNILHTDSSAEARIMAALSLFKIGNEKGIFAIKRAIEFDSADHVRRMCKILYQMYEIENQAKKE